MIESTLSEKHRELEEAAMETVRPELGVKLKEFFGLSRMTHSVLDIAHPALGAILVFGGAPRPFTIVIGLLAASRATPRSLPSTTCWTARSTARSSGGMPG